MKLNQESNLFDLYEYISGESEVPPYYHFWSCVAILAAAMEDKAWVEINPGFPIKPNCYIGLIGPGSIGKGWAMSQAIRILETSTNVYIYRGKLTHSHLYDMLGKVIETEDGDFILPDPKVFIVMDELLNGVGSDKTITKSIITTLTELYTATNYTFNEGNRSSGKLNISKPCVSWFFGSTIDWLLEVMSGSGNIFESGFVARCMFILADYDPEVRIFKPIYPKDRDLAVSWVQQRICDISNNIHGEFKFDTVAEQTLENWYYTREAPEDRRLHSIWKRQQEMTYRLCMVFSIAESMDMRIKYDHVCKALYTINSVFDFTTQLLKGCTNSGTFIGQVATYVSDLIQKHKEIPHSKLTKLCSSNRSLTAKQVRAAIAQLLEENQIERFRQKKTNGIIYRWL
jgi:hypothetical protein